MSDKPDYDGILKALPLSVLQALAHAVLPDISDTLEPYTTELALLPHIRLDTAFKITYQGHPCLLHIELQKRNDKNMPYRIFEYATILGFLYKQKHGEYLPVITIVIWIDQDGRPPDPVHTIQVGDQIIGQWFYHEVKLYENTLATDSLTYLVLAPLLQETTIEQLEPIATKLYQEAPEPHKVTLLAAFLQLAEAEYKSIEGIKQSILKSLGVNMADFKEAVAKSPVVVEIREEERAKSKAETLRKLWIKRFGKGAMTTDVEIALNQASPELLDQVAENFGDISYTLLQARSDIRA